MNITEMTPEQRKGMMAKSKKDTAEKIAKFKKENPSLAGSLNGVPKQFLSQYVKSLMGELTLKPAVRMKCLDCSHFDKEEIKNCNVKNCPLWQVRPYR
tara:strand:- start:201 stop:494 length:294 start_codon:yes stop_codon:yes gene_type:complete